MTLAELFHGMDLSSFSQDVALCEVSGICCDSRKFKKEEIFFALPGITTCGEQFIHEVIAKGAKIIVAPTGYSVPKIDDDVSFILSDRPADILKKVALRFYGDPSNRIHVVGITGTNGKTTVTYLLESILHESELACGIIGTVNYRMGEILLPAFNTTPGMLENQQLLARMVDEKCDYCLMEVSSHALDQGRVDLIKYKTAIFTNLTSDHLDYHGSRQKYFEAKTKLFTGLDPQSSAVINADDDFGRKLFSKTAAKIITYGIHRKADIMARDIATDLNGTVFKCVTTKGEISIRTELVGHYNISNILASVAGAVSCGIPLEHIKSGLERLQNVPGRLEQVDCQQTFKVFIDYAHTEDALENVLRTLKQTSDARIILVFGCGGDRDPSKRFKMGEVACRLADFTIITTDNPRSEAPRLIIDEIVTGFDESNYKIEVDRKRAIIKALESAKTGDIVLIAGKGHEQYQVLADRTISFNEKQIIRDFFRC